MPLPWRYRDERATGLSARFSTRACEIPLILTVCLLLVSGCNARLRTEVETLGTTLTRASDSSNHYICSPKTDAGPELLEVGGELEDGPPATTTTTSSSQPKSIGRASVTLNRESRALTWECRGGGDYLPFSGLERRPEVCPLSLTERNDCDKGKVFLADFIPQAKADWFAVTEIQEVESSRTTTLTDTEVEPASHKYVLTIPENGFPPVPTRFNLGCRYSNGDYCMISATVEAVHADAAEQTAACVYSDESPVIYELNMSEENNSIRLICGVDRFPQPWVYGHEYCSGDSVDPGRCKSRMMTDILPTFNTDWWKGIPESSEGAVFTIPEDDFPVETTSFLVGCSRLIDDAPFCNVNVTVAARTRPMRETTTPPPLSGAVFSEVGSLPVSVLIPAVLIVAHAVA
ncbi:SAG-related sequence [Besnoitia besnoiti]|uniref:SAG-related sequence n=1 Tax=Besnoitia besnoiti TaxID=94643 RepID=A0A2A9MNQ8_BESBE|nr:SAG-related sequence [Besnoitia besnoiti]PFH37593.1 SAG-related sequence [Besnoitia besnoiti]